MSTNIFFITDILESAESDLSTYSAHLSNMNVFIKEANPHTLILIDEFGTGTDPKFGGPIAEAVLETLNKKQVRGVVTTHYSNLKVFASNTEGLLNASMLFDTLELKALYKLDLGRDCLLLISTAIHPIFLYLFESLLITHRLFVAALLLSF